MLVAMNNTVFVGSFVAYTLAVVAVGLYSSRYAKRSDEDFFLAGRSLGKWVGALSASASSESGWVTLGLVGAGFMQGVRAFWMVPGCLLGYAFIWFVLAERMRHRSGELQALTIPDFFSQHFKERVPILRVLSVLVIIVAMLLYVAAQFAAAGKAFEAAFESISYREGVLIGGAIVLFYTVSGGFRAACWTDFLQALLMLVVLVAFPLYALYDQGGVGNVLETLRAHDPELVKFVPDEYGWVFVGFLLSTSGLGINFGYPGQPHVLVRFMALKDRTEVRQGAFIAIAWVALVLTGAVTAGLVVKAITLGGAEWGQPLLVSKEAAEGALVLGAKHLLPGVLAGAALAAVLAAICSTADSQLVVAASAVASDIYGRLISGTPGQNHAWLNRIIVFALGAGAVLLVMDKEVQVFNLVLEYGWAVLGAAFGPQLILVLLWKRASYKGCVAGMLTGFTTAIVWKLVYHPAEGGKPAGILWNEIYGPRETGIVVYNLALAFVLAMLVNIAVSLLTSPRRTDDIRPV
ncbi:MAG: sodium/proline symporter [Planctomycetes bacterium]|nr:sodium/proline symporter [Planctomycetota bacterium]